MDGVSDSPYTFVTNYILISDEQLELFRVGNPPLTASLAAVSPSIDDGFEIKKDDENDPKFGTYEYFRASSTGEKPRSGL